jgi:putative component of membrane protein insertase Oxa1/YidC/SpoIIIJ protein YidD
MLFNWIFLIAALPGFYEPWGKDADLKYEEVQPSQISLSPLGYLAEQLIFFHQNVISPVDGPRSHFRPSSSSYMLQAIKKHGFFKGYIMGCDRLLRENEDPWVYRTALIDGKIWKTDNPD